MTVEQSVEVVDDVEVVVDGRAQLAEGPLWDVDRQALLWVDIPAGEVHRYRPATGVDAVVLRLDVPVGAVVKRSGGGLVLAAGMGFARCGDDGGPVTWLGSVDRGIRMNDGACDPAGRFWAGTLVDPRRAGDAALYRLGPDHRVDRMLDGVTISNGLGWSPDGGTMYYVDTPTERVDAFDYDATTGDVTNRRTFADLRDVPGRPDGLAVDTTGAVWVAMVNGWAVRRFDPTGVPDLVVEMPAQKVTSCAFGGAGLDDLYITTATEGLTAAEMREQPHAGGVFRYRAGVAGLPAFEYRG